MLELILPAEVESQECWGETSGGVLFPEEEKIIANAVQARRRDYTAVRSCARACLERLGYPPVPILPGVGGAPTWPAGVQGSMTHCTGYAAAAVGRYPRIRAIGIDAEPDQPLPDGVLNLVATSAEQDRLTATQREPPPRSGTQKSSEPNWDRLLFSAKEAVYKAWFPLVGEWLDHQDVEIVFDRQDGTFEALLSSDDLIINGHHIDRIHGRWARQQGILATAIVLGRA